MNKERVILEGTAHEGRHLVTLLLAKRLDPHG
jgi:hypothetical protein